MRFPARGFWIAAGILLAAALGRRAVQKAAPAPIRQEPAVPSLRPLGLAAAATALLVTGYAGWLIAAQSRQTTEVARAMTGGDPERAPPLLRRYGCSGCHAIPGVPGAEGQVGGPLDGLRKRVFIAGPLPNAPDQLVDWIVSPPSFSPRTAMPVTGISREEARDVAAFLYGR